MKVLNVKVLSCVRMCIWQKCIEVRRGHSVLTKSITPFPLRLCAYLLMGARGNYIYFPPRPVLCFVNSVQATRHTWRTYIKLFQYTPPVRYVGHFACDICAKYNSCNFCGKCILYIVILLYTITYNRFGYIMQDYFMMPL